MKLEEENSPEVLLKKTLQNARIDKSICCLYKTLITEETFIKNLLLENTTMF